MKGLLTIESILHTKDFKNAKLIGGHTGILKSVSWVHISESPHLGDYLNGGELILCTGLGWQENEEMFVIVIKKAIAAGASGICIELGQFTFHIPQAVIDLANEEGFPVIIFQELVKFLDVSRNINIHIIQSRYNVLTELEEYSKLLNEVLLSNAPYQKMIDTLCLTIKRSVAFEMMNTEPIISFYKTLDKQTFKKNVAEASESITSFPIELLDNQYGVLYIDGSLDELSEMDSSIVKRTVQTLGQLIFRDIYSNDHQMEAPEWIKNWILGTIGADQLMINLKKLNLDKDIAEFIVMIIDCPDNQFLKDEFKYLSIFLKSQFKVIGIDLLPFIYNHQLTCILFTYKSCNRADIVAILERVEEYFKKKQQALKVAIGRPAQSLYKLSLAYKTANEVMFFHNTMYKQTLLFYQDIYIYRLIYPLYEKGILEDYVIDHLGPVIDYDDQFNSNLIETLRVYLYNNCSKKVTATALHIVRQSLYYRLERMKELIGKDFDEFPKKTALETALVALDFLNTIGYDWKYSKKKIT
ncbi:PucR family transcriptional regulator ligand-binding domain-containing protein [Lysinibacillus macroides]|uniref:PucR family transcriptional regulator n=1 Tax=Lysinibacillus macroides TaxID=33935 RepID=A0A0M9DLS9_9BACI|nr:PucR family transcriptional regulator ligand-binding domain-containing protein [Lysinibacillus macroides]KOY84028.1 hypothetical protein ADM90_01040 [Lysinibacillus macroides]QPR66798.1 PucR family transcriptional regulator ligand-binding domain-containing protein [Lysinibacillus macroides]